MQPSLPRFFFFFLLLEVSFFLADFLADFLLPSRLRSFFFFAFERLRFLEWRSSESEDDSDEDCGNDRPSLFSVAPVVVSRDHSGWHGTAPVSAVNLLTKGPPCYTGVKNDVIKRLLAVIFVAVGTEFALWTKAGADASPDLLAAVAAIFASRAAARS